MARLTALAVVAGLVVAGCVSPPPSEEPSAVPTTAGESEETETADSEGPEEIARGFTVRVRNRTCDGVGTGSGTVISPTMLATNAHVVDGALELEVETWDGRSVDVDVASVSHTADLAIVEVSEPLDDIGTLDTEALNAGDPVTAVGYPGGGQLKFTTGDFVDRDINPELDTTEAVIRFTAPIAPGNSGGPLLNEDGRIAGVVFAEEIATGYGLAVPVDVLNDTLEDGGQAPIPGCDQWGAATLYGNQVSLRTEPVMSDATFIASVGNAAKNTPITILEHTADGWYRINIDGLDGWMFGSFVLPPADGFQVGETRSGQPAVLRDASGNPTGEKNESANAVLITNSTGDLWELMLPDGRTGWVNGADITVVS